MYSMYAFMQSAVWNTWGPISTTSEDAFGWDDSTVALLNNWGPISYMLTGLFYPWLLQVKGLRWAIVSSMFFVAAGTAFRVITSYPPTATILIHIGQFLNGVGGPISTGSIPAISAAWFPPHERVTATALSNSINNFGQAVTFILGPALVSTTPGNSSTSNLTSRILLLGKLYQEQAAGDPDNATVARQLQERHEIMLYMYYACGACVLLFVLMLLYFPAKPPHPPCVSATVERTKYWEGLWFLRKKVYFLLITLSYGISTGVMVAWGSVININLKTVGVDEETAGMIGFYSTLAGCAASLLVGRFADWFVHYMKLYILIMYILATIALIVFSLMLINVIPHSLVGFYVTVIASTALVNAAVPLLYELACEMAFPTSEAAANGLLTLFNSFWSLVFLAVLSIPGVGTMWMNWTIVGSTAVCIPLIALIKGRFNRLEVDECIHTENYTEQEVEVPDDDDDNVHSPLLANGHVPTERYVDKEVPVPRTYGSIVPRQYAIQNNVQNGSVLVDTNGVLLDADSHSDFNVSDDQDEITRLLVPDQRV
ncbi:unnamed protein product [Candidula unifasciata]|uniref:Major facilitator superfamily (MFS) profile domain-containing protein n=1 Tax=Candidula unifasciata TaxID=100452 RepID=A0A8S3ZIA5_9EUPU|nr:unnamed protein product [Candidula unifasciata]